MRFPTTTSCAAAILGLATAVLGASGDPCAEFAASRQLAEITGLDAKLYRSCIQSVPFNANKAAETLKNLRLFLGLDTLSQYHIDPPTSELELEPFNLNKTLSKIDANIKSGAYPNNWSFDYDVVRMFQLFRDGHTDYETVCSHGVLYIHNFPIASIVSEDNGLPELYHVIKDFGAKSWEKPKLGSKIKKINGKDPKTYMDDFIRNSAEALDWVDPDARYNEMLYGFPEGAFRGRFARRNLWNGEEIRITWENGTDTMVEFTVQLTSSMVDTNTGELLFKDLNSLTELCFLSQDEMNGKVKRQIEQRDVVQKRAAVSAPNGYPTALSSSEAYAIATYAVPGDKDTVVLAIRTFDAGDLDSKEFIHAMSKFVEDQIASWKKTGYKRLIIDVSNNDGGKSILPYDILKQLFPSKDEFPTVNMHYSPVTWAYIRAIDTGNEQEMYKDVNMKDFADMTDFLGPVQKDGGYFTKMWKQDYQQFAQDNYDLNVTAHPSSSSPFAPEDIAIVSNSMCASACHSLVESLRSQGVRAFAYGGRAAKSTPMQASGGTKGGKVLRYDDVRTALESVAGNSTIIAAVGPEDTWMLKRLPVRIRNVNVNSENKFRDGNRLPLQFVYTPACNRFFMNAEMLQDVTAVWNKIRDIAWDGAGKKKACINYTPIEGSDMWTVASDDNGGAGTGHGHSHANDSVGDIIWQHMRGSK